LKNQLKLQGKLANRVSNKYLYYKPKEINAFEKQLKSLLLKLVVLIVISYVVWGLRKKLGIKIGGKSVRTEGVVLWNNLRFPHFNLLSKKFSNTDKYTSTSSAKAKEVIF
jgi:hypothetical protein